MFNSYVDSSYFDNDDCYGQSPVLWPHKNKIKSQYSRQSSA